MAAIVGIAGRRALSIETLIEKPSKSSLFANTKVSTSSPQAKSAVTNAE